MANPDLTLYSSYARQVIAQMLSADILTSFPECRLWLENHASDLHDWQIVLPLVSCLAAGGSLEDGIKIASAWFPLCLASDLLDHLEDEEFIPDELVRSTNEATNLSTGLIFLSFHNLSSIQCPGGTARTSTVFSAEGLAATSGQHQDLLMATPLPVNDALEKYWQAVILKSGSVFRAAAAGGAAAGTADETVINGLGDYGTAVGVMLQLLDDGRDILKTSDDDVIQTWEKSLPLLLYSLSTGADKIVFPAVQTRAEWHAYLKEARIVETFSTIFVQWRDRALESIRDLALAREKVMLEDLLTLIAEPLADGRF